MLFTITFELAVEKAIDTFDIQRVVFFARDDVDMNVNKNSSFRKDVDEGHIFFNNKSMGESNMSQVFISAE